MFTIEEVMARVGKSKRAVEGYQKNGFLKPTKVHNPKGKDLNRYTEEAVLELEKHLAERDAEPSVIVAEPFAGSSAEGSAGSTAEPFAGSGLAVPEMPSFVPQNNLTFVALTPDQFAKLVAKDSEIPVASKPLLKISEAHQLTGIPEDKLREATKKGELKSHKFGRGIQVRRSDLDAWIGTHFGD